MQEVGGSSPPVPTSLRRNARCARRYGWQASRSEGGLRSLRPASQASGEAKAGSVSGRNWFVGEVVIAFDRGPRRDDRVRINERIRVREIRVIDDTGEQLGIMPPPQAWLSRAPRGWISWRSPHRRAAGLPDHGLREVPGRAAEAGPTGQETPEGDSGEGDQVPAQGRRARLPVQEEAHRALHRATATR